MRLFIDTEAETLLLEEAGDSRQFSLYSRDAFEALSRQWVRVGWELKYSYAFSWLGRPIIQLPEDMIRAQEVLFRVKPDVVIETGVAHGGSLVLYASVCHALSKGRVIGVEKKISSSTRRALEDHPLGALITLVPGDSVSADVVAAVAGQVRPGEVVLVFLDSNHSYDHVLAELRAYAQLVSVGSYIVATDGIIYDLADLRRGVRSWAEDNPMNAARDFVRESPHFVIEQPPWPFNESMLTSNVTYWPSAWLRRITS